MPALAQTKPWWVSTISTPRSARSTSRLSARISSTRAGSLPSTAASRRASAPGITEESRRTRPSALETIFCEMTTTSPSLQLGAGRRSARRRSSPRRSRAVPCDRRRSSRRRVVVEARRSYPQRLWRSRFGARSAAAPSSSRVSATTSAGVSRSSASEGSSSTAKGTPASRAAATWRAQLPSPKAGRIAPGGARTRALVPVAVAVGDDRDVALGNAGQQAVELARVEQRAVAGKQDDALGAVDLRRGRSRPAPPPTWPLVGAGRGRPRRRPRRRAPAAPRLAADDDRPLDRARLADRLQHVVEHRRDQPLRAARRRSRRRGAAWRRRSA